MNHVLEMDKSDLHIAIRQQLQVQETNEFKQSVYYQWFEELLITEKMGKKPLEL
jgi:hypothetical protein